MLPVIRSYSSPSTFGTARYLEATEARMLGLDEPGEGALRCPYVGEFLVKGHADAVWCYARPVTRESHELASRKSLPASTGHLLTFAPTRAGKGSGQIIPNLLTYPGSCIVIDVKGENYMRTAGYRESAKGLGQKVFRFSPFEPDTDVWNPIHSIGHRRWVCDHEGKGRWEEATEGEMVRDATYLASLLLVPSGGGDNQFWESSARNFITALLLHVKTEVIKAPDLAPDSPNEYRVTERSLFEVRRLLTLAATGLKKLIEAMETSSFALIRQAASTMAQASAGDSKTGQGIFAFARDQTEIWADKDIRRATHRFQEGSLEPATNSFEFSDLRDTAASLYIVIPPEHITTYAAVLRVLVGVGSIELKNYYPRETNVPPVLFLLDEFPQLGNLKPIEDGLLYLAGYGIRLWFFIQDIEQLKRHYPKSWRSYLSNTQTKCFFGINELETAQFVSEMVGSMTTKNMSYTQGYSTQRSRTEGTQDGSSWGPQGETENSSRNRSDTSGVGENVSAQLAYAARRLITPEELLTMRGDEMIVFFQGLHPLRLRRPAYYAKGTASLNPLAERAKMRPSRPLRNPV